MALRRGTDSLTFANQPQKLNRMLAMRRELLHPIQPSPAIPPHARAQTARHHALIAALNPPELCKASQVAIVARNEHSQFLIRARGRRIRWR